MQVRLARLRTVYEHALKRGKLELAGNLASELLDAERRESSEQPVVDPESDTAGTASDEKQSK
jgi:hypothetical protein